MIWRFCSFFLKGVIDVDFTPNDHPKKYIKQKKRKNEITVTCCNPHSDLDFVRSELNLWVNERNCLESRQRNNGNDRVYPSKNVFHGSRVC